MILNLGIYNHHVSPSQVPMLERSMMMMLMLIHFTALIHFIAGGLEKEDIANTSFDGDVVFCALGSKKFADFMPVRWAVQA